MKQGHRSLEELQAELPKFHRFKTAIPCTDELKERVLRFALEEWKEAKDVDISTVDGVKVTYPNTSWFLVRASGTEPALRCYSESRNLEEAHKLLGIVTELARKALVKAR